MYCWYTAPVLSCTCTVYCAITATVLSCTVTMYGSCVVRCPPFDEVQAYSIYTRTLERYTTLVMAKAYKIRAIIVASAVSPSPVSN
eukprot:scaffold2058_cov115-Isochrysis_galbana.AAC.26